MRTPRKTSIPPAPPGPHNDFFAALRERVELLGQRGEVIEPLPTSATLDDVIAKVNKLIERIG